MKKMIALLLATLMCLPLFACGEDAGVAMQLNETVKAPGTPSGGEAVAPGPAETTAPQKSIPKLDQPLSGALGDTVNFVLDTEGTLTISGEGKMQGFEYGDGVVNTPWFEVRKCIRAVVIEEGITNISAHTFYKCVNMESIVIPSTVYQIGAVAFCECQSLKEIVIPEGVTRIGNTTFSGCASLTNIVLPESLTSIAQYAFSGCPLTSITIPASVTFIGSGVFSNCENLTIQGVSGSYAETYAKENNISFQPV